jgi:flagellin-specific chaperone FliS
MPETPETFDEIRRLRVQVDDIGAMTETLVRAQSKELEAAMMERFEKDSVLKAVFLLVDAKRSQSEIAEQVGKSSKKGGTNATISRKIEILSEEMHLIELVDHKAKGKIYKRTKLDRILHISRKLEKKK